MTRAMLLERLYLKVLITLYRMSLSETTLKGSVAAGIDEPWLESEVMISTSLPEPFMRSAKWYQRGFDP